MRNVTEVIHNFVYNPRYETYEKKYQTDIPAAWIVCTCEYPGCHMYAPSDKHWHCQWAGAHRHSALDHMYHRHHEYVDDATTSLTSYSCSLQHPRLTRAYRSGSRSDRRDTRYFLDGIVYALSAHLMLVEAIEASPLASQKLSADLVGTIR